eukprot:TRINITY_DN86965_c0_g1_i1.p1 TRINITY_DN86965_c0_g1~~TRINITY_DN86965_c0_g1_i1.p1  ORF type:complete len:108 (+),score=5.84 TRINITY_DN86965_c0_g1_i1:171-494(+)
MVSSEVEFPVASVALALAHSATQPVTGVWHFNTSSSPVASVDTMGITLVPKPTSSPITPSRASTPVTPTGGLCWLHQNQQNHSGQQEDTPHIFLFVFLFVFVVCFVV